MATPESDPSIFKGLLEFLSNYLPATTLPIIGGLIWRSSAKATAFERAQSEHARKIEEHHIDIASLKIADAAARVTIAGLPTRHDLSELRQDIRFQAERAEEQIRAGFENLTRIIGHKT